MKAAEIKAAIARGERTFAVADNVKRFGMLSTVTASRVERGMVVVINLKGVEVDKRWRPAQLMPLSEAQAIIAAREAESAQRERELWGDDETDVDTFSAVHILPSGHTPWQHDVVATYSGPYHGDVASVATSLAEGLVGGAMPP